MGLQIADLFAKLSIRPDKKSFAIADKLMGSVKTALAGFLAYKTVTFFEGMIADTAELGSKFVDLSQQVGVPIEPLQQLGYAAQLSGSSLDGMAVGLKKLSLNIYGATKGGEAQIETFRALGVAYKDAAGHARPTEDVLSDLADHFKSMPDGTEKTALAMKALGKSGAELIPLLNEGGDGIAKLRQEFVDLGGQIDEETAKSLEEFGDQTDKVKTALIGVRNDAVKAILPELKKMATTLIAWIKANRTLIKQKLAAVMHGIVFALKALGRIIGTVVRVVSWFHDHLGLLAVILGSVAAAFVILQAAAIGAAIASAAAWVLAALPLVLIAALIGALILIVEDLWTWFRGGESVFGKLHEWAVDMFVDAIEFWADAFKDFFGWLLDKIDWLLDKIGAIPRAIKKAAGAVSSYLTGENGDDYMDPAYAAAKAESAKRKANFGVAVEMARKAQAVDHSVGTGLDRFPGMDAPSYPMVPLEKPPQVNMGDVVVNVPPGTNTAEVGPVVHEAMREFWDTKMRDLAPAVE